MTLYRSELARRGRGAHRRPGIRPRTLVVLGLALVVMSASAIAGIRLKVSAQDAAPASTVSTEPSWAPASHPVGTGESLYLRGGKP